MNRKIRFTVDKDSRNFRLDKFLAEKGLSLSRSSLQHLIKQGGVKVERKEVKPSYRLKEKERIEVNPPKIEKIKIKKEDLPLEIIYEDSSLLVVNKPAGMITHPAPKVYSGTLVNALLHHTKSLSTINGPVRPGIVHRLDRETTGLLAVAKDNPTHLNLARQLAERTMKRRYFALVNGKLKKDKGKIEIAIGRHPQKRKKISVHTNKGRKAITFYKVLERFPDYTLMELRLGTGRTHQIRVHLAYLGHPIAGDKVYGGKKGRKETLINRPALHAYRLGFRHPVTGHFLEFSIPLPADFQKALRLLGSLGEV